MEESQGPQYAVQIAVHTLRDRCRNLQQRVALLEKENSHLKVQCSRHEESKNSLDELDSLRAQVAELSQQKEQLQNKVNLITKENQDIWGKLSKFTKVNKSLETQLTKINDTLMQHTVAPNNPVVHQTNLIRSKTFTKHELQTKVLQKNLEENDKISLELEDISLKLSDSFSKQKQEIDMLCSEISDMTFTANEELNTENCGFLFDEELEDDVLGEIQCFVDDFKLLKDVVIQQRTVLVENLKNMNNLKEKLKCRTCELLKPKLDKSTSTIDLQQKTYETKSTETDMEKSHKQESTSRLVNYTEYPQNCEKICPICSQIFQSDVDFTIFQHHVEDHFVIDSYEML